LQSVIVIGGGVGPLAGLDLHRLIIDHTRTDGRDQDHRPVLHFSCSELVPDRTDSLLAETPEAPARGMVRVLAGADAACARMGTSGVAGIPCNTFHAPPIWTPFARMIKEQCPRITLVHMIDETLRYLKTRHPEIRSVGVLSTTGTRLEGIYRIPLERAGYTVVEPEDQEGVHASIYDVDWGIKSAAGVNPRAVDAVTGYTRELAVRGAGLVILGCSELPLALPGSRLDSLPLLNPVDILARRLVELTAS